MKKNDYDELIEILEELQQKQNKRSFDENFTFYDDTLRHMGVFLDKDNLTEEQIYYIKNIPPVNYYLDMKKKPSQQAVYELIKYVKKRTKIWGKKVLVSKIQETHSRIDGECYIKHYEYGLQIINYIIRLKKKYNVDSFFTFHLYDVKYSIITKKRLFARDTQKYKKWTGLSTSYKKHYYPRYMFISNHKENEKYTDLTDFPHKIKKVIDKKYDRYSSYRRKYNFAKKKEDKFKNTLIPLDCNYNEFIEILREERDKVS